MTELRKQINNIVEDYNACKVLAKSVGNPSVYEGTTATEYDIRAGKTAYSNGEFIEGTLEAGNTTIDTTGMSATNSTNTIAAYITAINELDTSALKAATYTFYCCKSLKRIPPLNTNNLTRMDYMFYNCNALQELNLLNTNKVTYMDYAFYGCSSLKTIQLTNTNKVTSFKYTFENCTSLESISGLNTESCGSFVNMFSGCTNLKATPLISFTQSGPANVNAVKMFNGCASLVDVSFYAPNNGYGGNCLRYMTDMFTGCSSLSDESLNNIMSLCVGTSVDTTPKTLKGIGLSLEQVTRCQSLSNYQALLNRGWTTGY